MREERRPIRHLIAATQAALLWLWTSLWISVALLVYLLIRRRTMPLVLARRVWAPFVLRVLGARLQISGLDRVDFSRPYLFVANHCSMLDVPVLFAALPVPLRFLAKAELRRVPFLGRYIAAMGMVFIDRVDSAAARESVEKAALVLRSGASLVAFPEGTRSRTGRLQPFKTGAFVAAIKAPVPVVPVRVVGSAAVLPPDGFAPRAGRVGVVIGEPIGCSGLTVEDRGELARQAHRGVDALGREMSSLMG